jgi:CubicO group peptidase (beta-lactamase class C family)
MSMNNAKLMYKPGTHFTYSNADYAVLGAVIETASGVPFEEYVQKHIFDPLGMKNSAFKKENLTTQAIAAGYIATVDDRTLDAPLYEQGNKPAGSQQRQIVPHDRSWLTRSCRRKLVFNVGRYGSVHAYDKLRGSNSGIWH